MRARKVDGVQPEIVKALRAAGVLVEDCSRMGRGFPDLLCGYQGRLFLVEIKMPKEQLNERQVLWHSLWEQVPKYVVHSVEEALACLSI